MEGHMTLYKYVLHHSANTVPKWFLEAIGTYVSRLNGCDYCVEHHFEGMRRILGDDARATAIRAALDGDDLGDVFDAREASALRYAEALTRRPTSVTEAMIDDMRGAGLTMAKSSTSIRSRPISPTPTAPSSASARRPRATCSACRRATPTIPTTGRILNTKDQ